MGILDYFSPTIRTSILCLFIYSLAAENLNHYETIDIVCADGSIIARFINYVQLFVAANDDSKDNLILVYKNTIFMTLFRLTCILN
jgi:hypothetical protein